MKIRHEEKLFSALDSKIKLLGEYRNITEEMNGKDFDYLDKLISRRDEIIANIKKSDDYVLHNISKQAMNIKTDMMKIFKYDFTDDNTIYKGFISRQKTIENILNDIKVCERDVSLHIDQLKDKMVDDMKKNETNRKIIDYYNSAVGTSFNGGKFNISN